MHPANFLDSSSPLIADVASSSHKFSIFDCVTRGVKVWILVHSFLHIISFFDVVGGLFVREANLVGKDMKNKKALESVNHGYMKLFSHISPLDDDKYQK